MNYQRIYATLIESSRTLPYQDTYFERHHIVPRCLGGGDEPNNIVRLSARRWEIRRANQMVRKAA